MSADELEFFYVHTVTVELPGDEGPWGAEPGGTSEPIRCFVDVEKTATRQTTESLGHPSVPGAASMGWPSGVIG